MDNVLDIVSSSAPVAPASGDRGFKVGVSSMALTYDYLHPLALGVAAAGGWCLDSIYPSGILLDPLQ